MGHNNNTKEIINKRLNVLSRKDFRGSVWNLFWLKMKWLEDGDKNF